MLFKKFILKKKNFKRLNFTGGFIFGHFLSKITILRRRFFTSGKLPEVAPQPWMYEGAPVLEDPQELLSRWHPSSLWHFSVVQERANKMYDVIWHALHINELNWKWSIHVSDLKKICNGGKIKFLWSYRMTVWSSFGTAKQVWVTLPK